jgi:hypothetical protein
MMKESIDFSKEGGFPLTQGTLEILQRSYSEAIGVLAGIIGDRVIVSGCEDSPTGVVPGWLCIDGELLPFEGGAIPILQRMKIVEEAEDVTFGNLSEQPVYIKRRVVFDSDGYGSYKWDEFGRIKTLQDLSEKIIAKEVTMSYVAGESNTKTLIAVYKPTQYAIFLDARNSNFTYTFSISTTIPNVIILYATPNSGGALTSSVDVFVNVVLIKKQ